MCRAAIWRSTQTYVRSYITRRIDRSVRYLGKASMPALIFSFCKNNNHCCCCCCCGRILILILILVPETPTPQQHHTTPHQHHTQRPKGQRKGRIMKGRILEGGVVSCCSCCIHLWSLKLEAGGWLPDYLPNWLPTYPPPLPRRAKVSLYSISFA